MDGEMVSAEEIRRLQPRVGLTERDRLQWAVRFAQADPDTWTPGDLSNLQREFAAFAAWYVPPAPGDLAVKWPTQLPTEKALRDDHQDWRQIVEQLLTPGGQIAVEVPVEYRIKREPEGWTHSMEHLPGNRALYNLLEHLKRQAHLLSVCPEERCGRWFVARRKGQKLCSRTCLNRVSIRAKRQRDKERAKQPSRGRGRGPRHRQGTARRR